MKNHYKYILIASLLAILLGVTSCAKLYVPPASNTPLITKEGDGNIDVGLSSNNAYIMGGYGLNDKLAFIGDINVSYSDLGLPEDWEAMIRPNGFGFYSQALTKSHSSAHVGLGRYWSFDRSNIVVETYGGVGGGVSGYTNEALEDQFKNDYFSGFLQLNTGYKTDNVELGMMFKIIGTMFTMYYPRVSDEYLNTHPNIGATSTQFPIGLGQFGFTARFGSGRFKFLNSFTINQGRSYVNSDLQNISGGLEILDGYSYYSRLPIYSRMSYTLGVSFRF